VLVLLVAVAATVQATHGPTVEQVVAKAGELGMSCSPGAAEVTCTGPEQYYFRSPGGVIRPVTGPLQQVFSRVDAHSNGVHDFLAEDRAWMTDLHTVGCGNASAVRTFIDAVAAQFEPSEVGGTYGPVVAGECSMIGELSIGQLRTCSYACWFITSNPLAGAFPTPTPPPPPPSTPRPTPVPTPTPTPTPSPTPTASPTPSPTTSPTPSGEASGTPEGSVAGVTFEPEPSIPPPDSAPLEGNWVASVPHPADVSTEPAAIASSALLALLLLLFMGFVGELFNNTAKANYDVLVGWWAGSWLSRRLRWFTDFWKSP
jgi:hypothetical protein